jgi:TPR repeat protein
MDTMNNTEDAENSNISQYAIAMNMLGIHYDKIYKQLALECYKKSYKKGCKVARYNFADLLSYTQLEDEVSEGMRYDKCIKLYEKYILTHPEDPDAYTGIGNVYAKKGLYDKKVEYYTKAFNLGQYKLLFGIMHSINDSDECTRLADIVFDKIMSNHDIVSLYHINQLALMYSDARNGVKEDHEKGVILWEILVLKEYPNAMYNLGFCYTYGEGIERNYQKAFELYTKCIEHKDTVGGNIDSYRELGLAYEFGRGVERDPIKSMEYYTLGAINQNNPDPVCCTKIVKHLQKTKGTKNEYKTGPALYYDKETTKLQSKLMLHYIKYYEYANDQPKDLTIPFNVLLRWKDKLGYKINKLKQKIQDLELRPPTDGGELYKEAKERYTNNINKM